MVVWCGQNRMCEWMAASSEEIKRWVQLEVEAIKDRREAGDSIENEAHRTRALEATLLRNKAWQRARRRDARQRLLAATAGDDDDYSVVE